MKKQIINETFSLQIPDSFEILSETTLLEMYRKSPNPFLWGARNRENHVVLLALWKKSPPVPFLGHGSENSGKKG